jgi:YVTN family beta-propeller protein
VNELRKIFLLAERYLRVVSGVGRLRPVVLTGTACLLAAMLGCGDVYRPIVTNIPPVQPAPQPTKYAVVTSCGVDQGNASALTIEQACSNPNDVGLASYVDFSGDSTLIRLNLGSGPLWMGLSGGGGTGYTANGNGTINTFAITNNEETNQIQTSTLLPNAAANAVLSMGSGNLYVSEPGRSAVAYMFGIPEAVRLEVPVAANPVDLVGNARAQRFYTLSEGTGATATSCTAAAGNGTITAVEVATNTISAVIPAGVCPVYGVMSQNNQRVFVLNRYSGTITVIDSQQNQLDLNPNNPNNPNTPNFRNGIITLPSGPNGLTPEPIWADIYNVGNILAVVSQQSNTLTLINISLDSYGNDTPYFGQIIATIPVGNNPTSVAVLQDGTRVYVANHDDGTVSSVSLASNQVLATIPVAGHPISIAATTGTPMGKVYVISPDSNILSIIRTDNDTISNSLVMTGTGVQVRVTAQ